MRITNGMTNRNFNYNLHKNLTRMNKIDNQLNTGKEINKISDDPAKAAKIMRLKTDIAKNIQYNKNIVDATNHLDVTDKALEQANDGLQKMRELLVSAGNATYGSDERAAIKEEISQLVNKMGDILNTTFDGKYIFGGERIDQKPVEISKDPISGNIKLDYNGKNGQQITQVELDQIKQPLEMEISSGVKIDYGVNVTQMLEFKDKDGNDINLMESFGEILENLDATDEDSYKELITKNLEQIDNALQNVSNIRGQIGSKQNRMEDALERNEEEKFNIKEILSSIEDIDFAEKTIDYVTAMTMYTASLQASSKIMQPSLIDYLR